MNRKLLLAIVILFLLVGCAHFKSAGSKGKESTATDFDALVSNAKRDLAPRTLPNGKLYCSEEAKTQREEDDCLGDVEDTLLDSESDKAIGLANLIKAVDRIKISLFPCGVFTRIFNPSACKIAPTQNDK